MGNLLVRPESSTMPQSNCLCGEKNIMSTNILENLRYSKDHEWVSVEGDVATIGITDYAQSSLGDIVYIEFPTVGDKFAGHESFGSVESVKAVSELFTPVSGEVLEVNEALNDEAEKVNSAPYDAWMIKVKMENPGEADAMLSAAEYEEYLSNQ
jgi:glycine cleavage system H protein